MNQQIQKASDVERTELLKDEPKSIKKKLTPFVTTYNRNLPDVKKCIDKTWNLLQINDNIKQSFIEKPFIVYRRKQNLRDILGQTTILNNQVKKSNRLKTGKCSQCLSSAKNLCCKQVKSTKTFTSNITKKKFDIFHHTNCKSKFVFYLMECRKCKIQCW